MPDAPVTPAVVEWAIEESGLTVDQLAERMKLESSVISAWASGFSKPSKGQLTELAKRLKRPRAMFFLPEAPHQNSLPDGLRTAAGARSEPNLNFDERLWVRRARRLQDLLSTLRDTLSATSPSIRQASLEDDPQDVGLWLRAWAGVDWEAQREWANAAQAFNGWRTSVEANGVAVLALPMGRDGIRGFALNSDLAPLVAVNTADIPQARSFTLFHELAHLSLNQSVPCAAPSSGAKRLERWCDRVSSNTLIPRAHLTSLRGSDELALITQAANRFKVSRRAAAIALEEVGRVEGAFQKVEAEWPYVDRAKKQGGGGGGRTSPKKCIDELGSLAVGTIIGALSQGKISELQLRDHLRLDPTQVSEASQLLGSGNS